MNTDEYRLHASRVRSVLEGVEQAVSAQEVAQRRKRRNQKPPAPEPAKAPQPAVVAPKPVQAPAAWPFPQPGSPAYIERLKALRERPL